MTGRRRRAGPPVGRGWGRISRTVSVVLTRTEADTLRIYARARGMSRRRYLQALLGAEAKKAAKFLETKGKKVSA